MAQIFISYARHDRDRIEPLVELLSAQGWGVWWDREIRPGEAFDATIERALDEAQCVVAVWSESSVRSEWVKTEAYDALERRILVPVMIDDVRLPLAFRRTHTARLVGWTGGAADPEVESLLRTIGAIVTDGDDGGAGPPDPPDPREAPEVTSGSGAGPGLGGDGVQLDIRRQSSGRATLVGALGIETVGGVFSPIVEAESLLPIRVTELYSTAADDQTSVEIHLLQGAGDLASENQSVDRFTLSGIEPAPSGIPQIEVVFDVDDDGVLRVSARDRTAAGTGEVRVEGNVAGARGAFEDATGSASGTGAVPADLELPLTLYESAQGCQRKVTLERYATCETCGGSGINGRAVCSGCDGEGRVHVRERLTLDIPAGLVAGDRVPVRGKGDAGRRGAPPGDLMVRISEKPTPGLRRDGRDIHSDVSVPHSDEPTTVEVRTVWGPVRIAVHPEHGDGVTLRLRGQGLPPSNRPPTGDAGSDAWISLGRIFEEMFDQKGDHLVHVHRTS